MKVWVVLGTEEDDSESGYRYISGIYFDETKARKYAEDGWAMTVEEYEVKQ